MTTDSVEVSGVTNFCQNFFGQKKMADVTFEMTQGSMCSHKQDKVTNPLKRGASTPAHEIFAFFEYLYQAGEKDIHSLLSFIHQNDCWNKAADWFASTLVKLFPFVNEKKMFKTTATSVNLIQF